MYAWTTSDSMKLVNGVPGLTPLSVMRRFLSFWGSVRVRCSSLGGGGGVGGGCLEGSVGVTVVRYSSRISPSAVKIRLSVTLMGSVFLSFGPGISMCRSLVDSISCQSLSQPHHSARGCMTPAAHAN